jgi:hypothetical protein
MSVRDPEEVLESLIRKHVSEGNIIPFPKKPVARSAAKPANAVTVTGHGNAAVVGSHNQISIKVLQPTRKVIAEVKPGAVHITDREAAKLKEMVADICKKSGKPHQFVWSQLLRHMVVPQYRLIPAGAYPDAVAYLERWLARFGHADQDDDAWATRKRHLAYIKINQKKKGLPDALLHEFVREVLGKTGLSDCSNSDLEKVRGLVKAWTRSHNHRRDST